MPALVLHTSHTAVALSPAIQNKRAYCICLLLACSDTKPCAEKVSVRENLSHFDFVLCHWSRHSPFLVDLNSTNGVGEFNVLFAFQTGESSSSNNKQWQGGRTAKSKVLGHCPVSVSHLVMNLTKPKLFRPPAMCPAMDRHLCTAHCWLLYTQGAGPVYHKRGLLGFQGHSLQSHTSAFSVTDPGASSPPITEEEFHSLHLCVPIQMYVLL